MKMLWLQTELLHPVDRGGRIRTWQMLKELKRSHHITYLTLDDGTASADARERSREYCHELICFPQFMHAKFSAAFYWHLLLNLFSPQPYAIRKYYSDRLFREAAAQVRRNPPDVIVCDFLAAAVNLPEGLPCATVLFQHNVEAVIWRRHYEVQSHPLKRAYLYGQWRKMFAFEKAACHRFDQVIAVSAADCDTMRRDYGVSNVADVPTGVDTEFFRPSGQIEPDRYNLVFTGSMDWLPNEDAIQYFTEQILPRIRQAVPEVTLTVVGRSPFPSLLELSKRDPAIIVTGRVEDVRPHMERAAAYIVPLRIGGGTRIKIYEAMAMEKAIVSTSVGAEGLPVNHGREILLADTPEAFAGAVIRVLKDQSEAERLGTNSARLVREQFGWGKVSASFAEICQQAIERRAGKRISSDISLVSQAAPEKL